MSKRARAFVLTLGISFFGSFSSADSANTQPASSGMEEFNPFAVDAEETLKAFDREILEETGESPLLEGYSELQGFKKMAGCYRESCTVWAHVSKPRQRLYFYVDGELSAEWPVSTGVADFSTPDFDQHPNGRVYNKYSSKKYPGGDYKGLGNMPYAVFIEGGFAIHGTPKGNWRALGTPASHGCIRVHPENARIFNRFVREFGIENTWISVSNETEWYLKPAPLISSLADLVPAFL